MHPPSSRTPHPGLATVPAAGRPDRGPASGEAAAPAAPPQARPRWRDAWRQWRDQRLASPGFRRWAARFPLTRPIAQRQAQALFDLVAGFVYSQVLLACVRLGLFNRLAGGPRPAHLLAEELGLDEPACQRLLAAAATLDLVEARGPALWGLGPLGAVMVGNTAIESMVLHHGALYHDLRDPVALLRGQAGPRHTAAFWPYAGAPLPDALGADAVGTYSQLMSASQPLVAEEVLDAVDLRPFRCLLDAGGGEGRFLTAAAARAPRLQLMLLDLPAVAQRAQAALAQAGLAHRARVHGQDFLHGGPWPRGADLVSLVRVIHDHDDAPALQLLQAAHAALPVGGQLLLAEPMADTPGAARMADAYFGLYLLAMGSGRPRSRAELSAMLETAGFRDIREAPTRQPLQTRVLLARRTRA